MSLYALVSSQRCHKSLSELFDNSTAKERWRIKRHSLLPEVESETLTTKTAPARSVDDNTRDISEPPSCRALHNWLPEAKEAVLGALSWDRIGQPRTRGSGDLLADFVVCRAASLWFSLLFLSRLQALSRFISSSACPVYPLAIYSGSLVKDPRCFRTFFN